jgi:DNA-binding XRE family transcriptional regulator
MITQENVRDKILEFRAKNKMTQERFAELAMISRLSVIKIESGKTGKVNSLTLWKINHLLGKFNG